MKNKLTFGEFLEIENKLVYTLDKYNLKMDINDNILSNDRIIINCEDITSYKVKDCEYGIYDYIIDLIEEYIINKRNDIIDDILK